jgi:hypothetical protein
MGCGPGLTLTAQLSQARGYLAATNLKCTNGNEYALAGGGVNDDSDYVKTVDIYKNDDDLERTNDGLEGPARSSLAATTIRCNDGKEYALFGGGFGDGFLSNDVDVFACNEEGGGVYQNDKLQFTGPARYGLAATTIRCGDGKEYALFGGGFDGNNSNDVDVFACNEDGGGVYNNGNFQFTGSARYELAATTIRCNDGKEYALFGGGMRDGDRSNDVDVFACNEDGGGVYQNDKLQFTGPARRGLAATTITCPNGKQYALFGGGEGDGVNNYSNAVDVFACNEDGGGVYQNDTLQFTGLGRYFLAATTIRCPDGKQYALFAGGYDGGVYSNDVDIFACNEDGKVYHKAVIQFTGPARADLAATTITIDCKQYALFMGGQSSAGTSDAIDIYDCETASFLPQP